MRNKLVMTLLCALAMVAPARAFLIDQEIPATAIAVVASSEYSPSQSVQHLIDGSGLTNGQHDNQGGRRRCGTLWKSPRLKRWPYEVETPRAELT